MNFILYLMTKTLVFYSGTAIDKIWLTFELSMVLGVFASLLKFVQNFIVDEAEFMALVGIAIIIDHVIGSFMWLMLKKWSTKKNIIGLFIKVGLCVCAFLLFEGLNHILGEENFLATYFKVVTNLTLFLYPAGSALINMSVITNGTFPPIGWIQKIKSFNEELNIDKFKDFKNEEK